MVKFTAGFAIGAVVGGYLIYNMTPRQRSRVASTAGRAVDKVRSSSIADSVASNIGDVAGAASARVAGVVDAAGSTIADTVAPSNGDSDAGTVE